MRKVILSFVCLMIFLIPVQAQSNTPVVEVFGGYSYLNFDFALRSISRADRQHGHGVGINVAGNITDTFGIVGDFSFHAKDVAIPDFGDVRAEVRTIYALFGPRFSKRGERATAFAQALVGVGTSRDEIGQIHKHTGLAFGFGGGVDINVNKNVAIRAVQFDYLPMRSEIDITDEKKWLHNARLQVGIVFRFGSR